jgi:hypothetical protein
MSTLYVDSIQPKTTNGIINAKGMIIQVVNSTNAYSAGTALQTYVDIQSSSGVSWETSITPQSTESKIMVMPSLFIRSLYGGGASARFALQISAKIGSASYTNILNNNVVNGRLGGYDYGNSGLQIISYYCPIQIFSPNSTDVCTIKFRIKSDTSSTSANYNEDNYESTCVLMEIGG